MKNLNDVYTLSKNLLSSFNVEGINIELENSSIILYGGKKEIGSSIRIYSSKKEKNFTYCYGNFQTEIENENIENRIKEDLQKLTDAVVSNKYKSPLTQFLNQRAQQRIKEVNETKAETATEKIDANKLDNKNFSELLHKNLNEHKENQRIEIAKLRNEEEKIFIDKVNNFFQTVKSSYRNQLLNSTKNGVNFINFGFSNNINDISKGKEMINELKEFNSYNNLINQLSLDNLKHSFEVVKSPTEQIYFSNRNEISVYFIELKIFINNN